MKPLSGMWLYINLGFAIIWDLIGWVLFIINFIPGVNIISLVGSFLVDFMAFTTDIIFCIIYQGYLQIYKASFKLYQMSRIKDMLKLSRTTQRSGNPPNPVANLLAKQTQKMSKYALDKFANYLSEFMINKIKGSLIAGTIELIPFIGDLSPSWTIKAWNHISHHGTIARELKAKNIEFENSINKWRRSLRLPIGSNNIRALDRQAKPATLSSSVR